jgi:hypothetical protein
MINNSFKDRFQNKISLKEIVNKNIIATCFRDMALYWIHSLSSDKEPVFIDKTKAFFYSKKNDLYFLYLLEDGKEHWDDAFKNIVELTKTNYLHYISHNHEFLEMYIDYFDSDKNPNLDYSILNYNSELTTDTHPLDLYVYKKIKYYFSNTNILKDGRHKPLTEQEKQSFWSIQNSDKFVLDFKYALIYFYFKLGFNYFQKGEQKINVSNRLNSIFLYSKTLKDDSPRYGNILMALNTNKIYDKEYSDEDWFFYEANYNYYHTPFTMDYNMCKFNLVMETNAPNFQDDYYVNEFLSEKTIKALITPTPSYVLLQYGPYNSLKEYGFYFLNNEFGDYDSKINYKKFCKFFKNTNDDEMNILFNKSFEKSKKNKELLEKYIYSDKEKEMQLLIKR